MKFFSKLAVVFLIIGVVCLAGCSDKEKAIGTAVANGDTTEVESLLDKGVSPDSKADDGKTLLMLAAYLGHADIVELLIDKGADVNAKDQDGKTALMYATEKGNVEITKLLLKNGADPNIADNNGKTALMYAVEKGNVEITKLLLENGADPNIIDNNGKTALMYTAEKGNVEIAKLLLENGANLNAIDNNGKTALQIAQDNNETAMIDLLSNWGKFAPTETPTSETTEAPTQKTIASLNEQLASIFFDFDKSEIRVDQIKALNDNLAILKDHPELYVIMGAHADERGSRDYNIELSAHRAAAVKKYLTEAGIAEDHFIVYAYGKDHPLKKGHDEASQSINRRVDILMWDTKLSSAQVLAETIE